MADDERTRRAERPAARGEQTSTQQSEGRRVAGRPAASQRTAAPTALYPRVLGADWGALHPAVQRAHDAPNGTVGTGTFVVTRSPGVLSGLLLDLAGAPAASAGTGVRVVVQPDSQGKGESWQRAFDGRPLPTHQHATANGLLAERFGPFEFQFRLSAEDGALRFRQARQLLCLGPLCIPLPAWAAPQISAREAPGSNSEETAVAVRVTTSQGALLLAYAGTVRWTNGDAERAASEGANAASTERSRRDAPQHEGRPA